MCIAWLPLFVLFLVFSSVDVGRSQDSTFLKEDVTRLSLSDISEVSICLQTLIIIHVHAHGYAGVIQVFDFVEGQTLAFPTGTRCFH